MNSPLSDRLYELKQLYGQYSAHMLCDALNVSRGTFYNHILRNKRDSTLYAKRREDLKQQISDIYDESLQRFGSGKTTAVLHSRGISVSLEMVRSIMRDLWLISIRQGTKDYYDKEAQKYKNYLNQKFDVSRPNEVWVSDVTYYKFKDKSYYICVVIDLFSRMVVGYSISNRNSTQLVKMTIKKAIKERHPAGSFLYHTDRGMNYRSKAVCDYLSVQHIRQSFSRAYVPYDNSVMESFFSTLKREELYRTKYRSEHKLRAAIEDYMVFTFKAPT